MSRVEEVVRTGLNVGGTIGTSAGSAGTIAPQPITLEGDIHLGDIKVINEESSPAHVQNSETLNGLTQIDYLKAIRDAVDQVEEIENTISVNVGDVEKFIAGAPGPNNVGGDGSSTWKGTNELLTDALTSLQVLDNASGGSSNVTGEELQVDIVAELPAGTKNIGHVDIDTLIPTANSGQKGSAFSLSVTPATDIVNPTYIGDIRFGESLPQGSAIIGGVTTALDAAAKIAGATVAATDEGLLLAAEDSNNAAVLLQVDANSYLKVASDTELTTKDYNTGGGTENVAVVGLAVPGASGSVAVDGTNKLPVNTGLTDFDGVVTNTVLTSLNSAINTNRLDVNIAAGGFDGALTNGTAAIGKVEVTAMPSTAVTGTFWQATQNTSQVQAALYTKQYTVTTTAAQAWGASSQATASGLTVLADTTNTGIVYVGGSTVTAGTLQATDGIPLAAGAAFTFSIDDANKIYAITASGVTGQKLNLVAM